MSKRLSNLNNKIRSWDDALRLRNIWAMKGETVAFTNGCFDILHLGHVSYLAQAADTAQHLIVAINTDASVKALEKAPNRPINPEIARAMVLSALSFVDAVVFFEQHTPLEIIETLKPDVLLIMLSKTIFRRKTISLVLISSNLTEAPFKPFLLWKDIQRLVFLPKASNANPLF
jgi:rfaE bifunctional protein nucleotidyltransferase chain/domain